MTGFKTKKVIEWLKIVSNIFLGVILLITIFILINYRQEVNEVIGGNDPERLMQKYEEKTNTKCLCADPNYGQVIYVSLLSE
jgi:hypothetical protein